MTSESVRELKHGVTSRKVSIFAWGTLDVDSNGNLFIGGVNLNTNQIWCIRSTNAKNGAVVPTFDRSTAVNLGGHIAFSEPINPEGLVGQIFLAVDRSGTGTNNNVYMLASVQPTGTTSGSEVDRKSVV